MRFAMAIAAALAAVSAPLGSALAWGPDARVEHTLAEGQAWAEVLPDRDGAGLIHAAIDIPAPPKTVWAVMTDCRLASKLVTSVTSCRILQADPQARWDVREQVTRGGVFFPAIHNVFRSDYQPYSLIRFHRLSGDLRVEEGEWRLEPLDGGAATRVIYVNRVALDIVAPAFLVRAGIKRDTPKVLLNLRRESVGAQRPTLSEADRAN
jgi:Polyketide cyclase / dehydrase and lipid transport